MVDSSAPSDTADSGGKQPDRLRSMRLTVLFSILGMALFALWYDYQVARPSVETAFTSITRLNYKINASASSKPLTARDIQSLLGQAPSTTFTDGPYRVEVYRWAAGLPFRSHDYYAVYMGRGKNKVFMRHYKFYLPSDELSGNKRRRRKSQQGRKESDYSKMMEQYRRQPGMWQTDDGDSLSKERPRRPT